VTFGDVSRRGLSGFNRPRWSLAHKEKGSGLFAVALVLLALSGCWIGSPGPAFPLFQKISSGMEKVTLASTEKPVPLP